ncbi:MAG: acylase [Gemmatimonadales bacterium]
MTVARTTLLAGLLAGGLILAASCRPAQDGAEILWDSYGVPHVYAQSEPEAFKALGYAQMASHADLLLKLYAEARGRAAEYFGPAELESDRYIRTMGVPARAESWLAAQTPAFRQNLEAFADGMTAYGRQHPELIADSVEAVLPITAVDVLAHAQRVVHFVFVYGVERAIASFGRPAHRAGSNTWAVAPSRSASGHAMLLANPHLAWSDLFLFYEAHLNGPGFNVYGATLLGFPTLAIAFNEHLGWSHTVNTYDGADTYRLTLDGDGYRVDGRVKPFESRTEVLKVRQPDGSLADDTLTIRTSDFGPVIADSGHVAFAVRVAGLDRPGMLQEWWDMGRATNFAEFEAAVKRLEIPMFNIMYADRDGRIYYLFGGDVPKRSHGDVRYWFGTVAGDTSANQWSSYLSYEELPKLLDPPTGWLQNANDPPWTSTVPSQLDPASYPAYVAPVNMVWRPHRSATMLAEDESVTFDEMIAYKHSTRMALADRLLDPLLAAARKSGSAKAKAAADVLERWDRQAQAESRGAVLFQAWAQRYVSPNPNAFATPWRLDAALETPSGLGQPAEAVKALEAAAEQVEAAHGSLDVPWGEVMRLRFAGKDLPGNGAPGDPVGVFRTAYYAPDQDGKMAIAAGDTYYAITEFGDVVRAKVLLAYGNATQPHSKHQGDQLELFARQEMRDAWFTRAEVEQHLELRETVR